ncbi:MAG: antirestriction protein ArdA [Oscillospiraceae bacterium]
MRSVFQVYAAAKDSHDGRSTTLCLPATPYEVLDVLDKTRVKDTGELYVQIEEYHRFSQLAPFLDGEADLCQLNALAQKLSELDDWQSISFEGLVKMEVEKREPFGIPRLIDLAYNADCCYVAADAEDDAALGKFYAENGFVPKVENLPDEVFELLDFQKIGRDCRTGEGGVFTSGGYVVQHTELAEAYKDMDLTLNAPDYTILLEISKGYFNDPAYDSEKTVRLPLPAEPAAMDAALTAVGAWDWREVGFRCLDCRVPSLISHIDGDDNIAHINRLAQKLQVMDKTVLTKFKAVLEATEDFSVLGATHTADALDEYLFTPQYASPEDMARDFLESSLGEAGMSTLLPHINLYAYGRALMEGQECTLTEYGLISREDGQSLKLMEQSGMEMM